MAAPAMHMLGDSAAEPARIVLTGAAGNLGRVLRAHFAARAQKIVASDRMPLESGSAGEQALCGDLADHAFFARLLQGAHTVLHFAGVPDNRPLQELLVPNFLVVGNLYQVARAQGVKRIILASSNHVTGMSPVGALLDASAPPCPDSHYGASKAWAESLARMYWDKHGIETLALRIGSCLAQPRSARHLSTWLSHADLCRLVDAALVAPLIGFRVLYGVSANSRRWWHNSVDAISVAVQDDADECAGPRPDTLPQAPVDVRWQGGAYAEDHRGE